MKKIILVIFVTFVTLASISAETAQKNSLQPQLALSPSRVEFTADENRGTKSVTVLNLGSEPMDVEVSVQNWDFDEDNNYRALPPSPQSLDQWLIINPVRLTIPAKGQQTVRMAIRPKTKPEAGEHRAMIFFTQQQKEQSKGVNVLFNIGVPVYAFFGDIEKNATLHSMSYLADKQELSFELSNEGNVYVRPSGAFMIAGDTGLSDEELLATLNAKDGSAHADALAHGKFAAKPVFAGERRTLNAILDAKQTLPDTYRLVVKADIAGTIYEKVYRIQNGN